jgi:hypothetical protein
MQCRFPDFLCRRGQFKIRIFTYAKHQKLLINIISVAAHFLSQTGAQAKSQIPDFFDGAPPLSYEKFPSLTAPLVVDGPRGDPDVVELQIDLNGEVHTVRFNYIIQK